MEVIGLTNNVLVIRDNDTFISSVACLQLRAKLLITIIQIGQLSMFELLYTSVAPTGLSEAELIDILEKARLKNLSLGITGMLAYYDREIMQILEGDEDKVQDLFQTILADQRHTSVGIICQGEIEHRAFTDWSMAFKLLNTESINSITANVEDLNGGFPPITMIKDSPNLGKKVFISLRDTLLN